jgi:hypothetical protein
MNIETNAQNPKSAITPPSPEVRAFCAALPIGARLSTQIRDRLTLCSHWLTLVNNKKKFPGENPSAFIQPVLLSTTPISRRLTAITFSDTGLETLNPEQNRTAKGTV